MPMDTDLLTRLSFWAWEHAELIATWCIWAIAGFFLLHTISSSLADRIVQRSEWTRFIPDHKDEDEDTTNDPGPK